MTRYVYIYSGMILTFGPKNMLNFRLSANSISERLHIFQRHNALVESLKVQGKTIINLYQTTLTFTETRLLI